MLSVLTFLVLASTFNANAVTVPNANAAAEGNRNLKLPFSCGDTGLVSQRYQQLYASSEFPQESCFITSVLFRQDGPTGIAFGPTIVPNTTIELSTSPNNVTNMSTTFAANIGSDVVTVFSGNLSLSSSIVCGAGPCNPFDIVIQLQQGFPYDPSKGDLLLDVRIPQCVITSQMDAVGSSTVIARAFTLDVGDPTDVDDPVADSLALAGESLTQGLVTFFFCDEPPECADDPDCDDGVFCNGQEICTGGFCSAVSACPPGVDGCVTTNDFCDEENDVCVDFADDSQCAAGEICDIITGDCITPTPEPPSGPIVIIPTMGQWGMVLAAMILGLYAVLRLRSMKDSEFK